MTVLLVLTFICIFLAVDYVKIRRKEKFAVHGARAPDIYFHPNMAPTMCDGGTPFKQSSKWMKLYKALNRK